VGLVYSASRYRAGRDEDVPRLVSRVLDSLPSARGCSAGTWSNRATVWVDAAVGPPVRYRHQAAPVLGEQLFLNQGVNDRHGVGWAPRPRYWPTDCPATMSLASTECPVDSPHQARPGRRAPTDRDDCIFGGKMPVRRKSARLHRLVVRETALRYSESRSDRSAGPRL